MVCWAYTRRDRIWGLIALGTIPIALFCLVFSKATGVLIASAVSLPCLLMWIYSRRVDLPVRTAVLVVIGLILIVLLATINYWMPPLFDMVLENSGKDAGLTGRILLWNKADEMIALRPVFGNGYDAFWVPHNLDAEYLWRRIGLSSGAVFNFHNTWREILVDLGVVGLVVFTAVAVTAALRLFYRVMIEPNFFGILCCTIAVFELPRFNFELIGFSNMHFLTLLVFIVLGYAFRPAQLPAVRRG